MSHILFARPLVFRTYWHCITVGLFLCLGTTGCLSVSKEMTPEKISVVNRFNRSVCVKATSAQEPLPGRHLRAEAIQAALCNALKKYGPFSTVVESGPSDYVLEVRDITVVDAAFANSMVPQKSLFDPDWADAESVWTLSNVSSGKVVWTKRVVGDFSAGFFDTTFSWVAVVRARRANTKAVSKYIEDGIAEISKLTL